MATTRHIYREEEPTRRIRPFFKHVRFSGLGNIRVVDSVKDMGLLSRRKINPRKLCRKSESKWAYQQGRVFPLEEKSMVIGRDPKSDILLDVESPASRHHATVYKVGAQWRIQDKGSLNGTLVNGNASRTAGFATGTRSSSARRSSFTRRANPTTPRPMAKRR